MAADPPGEAKYYYNTNYPVGAVEIHFERVPIFAKFQADVAEEVGPDERADKAGGGKAPEPNARDAGRNGDIGAKDRQDASEESCPSTVFGKKFVRNIEIVLGY